METWGQMGRSRILKNTGSRFPPNKNLGELGSSLTATPTARKLPRHGFLPENAHPTLNPPAPPSTSQNFFPAILQIISPSRRTIIS